MFVVREPQAFNAVWADAFNSREIANLMALYEEDAILADTRGAARGKVEIEALLNTLLAVPGTITGRNNFCLQLGDLALLRADWRLNAPDGTEVVAGSTAEIIRRQPDGRWLYVIDHAAGASLPSVI